MRVYVDLDLHHPDLLGHFLRNAALEPADLRVDAQGEVYWTPSGQSSLVIKFGLLPLGVWESVRITPEGYVLASDDTLEPWAYSKVSLGRIDASASLGDIVRSGSAIDRLREITEDYCTDTVPQITRAFSRIECAA